MIPLFLDESGWSRRDLPYTNQTTLPCPSGGVKRQLTGVYSGLYIEART
jgi:hypothetical protein